MKIKVTRNGIDEYGDLRNIDEWYVYYQTLNSHRRALLNDVKQVWLKQGYYSEPSTHLLKYVLRYLKCSQYNDSRDDEW